MKLMKSDEMSVIARKNWSDELSMMFARFEATI